MGGWQGTSSSHVSATMAVAEEAEAEEYINIYRLTLLLLYIRLYILIEEYIMSQLG
jgi:hypothetical protein